MELTTQQCEVVKAETWRFIFLGLLIIEISCLVLLGLSFTILESIHPGLILFVFTTPHIPALVVVLLLFTLETLASYLALTKIAFQQFLLSPMSEVEEGQDKESESPEDSVLPSFKPIGEASKMSPDS